MKSKIQIKHKHDNQYNVQQQDERFIQIQNLIQAKKQMLFEKQKQMCIISKQNDFLDVVKKDYEKYNDYIYKQKQDQMKALNILDTYIKELTKSGELTKYDLEDAKEEQKKIYTKKNGPLYMPKKNENRNTSKLIFLYFSFCTYILVYT